MNTKKKFLAVTATILALVLTLVAMPHSFLMVISATAEPCWTVPEGYNEHDYCKCAAFLEQTDENGVKNGEKLNPDYNLNNPETWTGFSWSIVGTEYFIQDINLMNKALCGIMDFSSCNELQALECMFSELTELDVSDCAALELLLCDFNAITMLNVRRCTALKVLSCTNNALTELKISDCTDLEELYCDFNSLTNLDVTNNAALLQLGCAFNTLTKLNVSVCSELHYLGCSYNTISEIDVSNCTMLEYLYIDHNAISELDITNNAELFMLDCSYNELIELDLSNNPRFILDTLYAEGNGAVGYYSGFYYNPETGSGGIVYKVIAEAKNDSTFLGWYNAAGELLSENETFDITEILETELVARFTSSPSLPGDVDANGTVEVADAILALRHAMGLIELTPEQFAAADIDGSGEIRIDDAITILRMAMGLLG